MIITIRPRRGFSGWPAAVPRWRPLYQVFQRHLSGFERMWTDTESGGCLPKFVTGELQGFLRCGILAYGFAQMPCELCRKRHLVAFSRKGRGFCPSCMGRRMNEGAANLVDHTLPEGIPLRQWVLALPHPLRYPLAVDAESVCRTNALGGGANPAPPV